MARLFYEDPKPEKFDLPSMKFEGANDESLSLKYLEKVSKLVPSEIVAGYISLIGLAPLVHLAITPWVNYLVFLACLILTPIYLNLQSEADKPKRNHLILSSIAFIVWAYNISAKSIIPDYYDPALGSIILIIFSLVSGVIPLNK